MRLGRAVENKMVKRTYRVKAFWDAEAGVYVADSDIIGLHIEAATLDEFEALLMELAPELIVANHMTAADLEKPHKDLVSAILWERPTESLVA